MLYQASAEINNLMDSSDDLIARVQSGDREAFGLIFEHHSRFIYKFIYAMLGEQSLAEELTQETFLGAYKGIHALRGEAQLKTWLCGIAKNVVYKSLRSNRKEGKKSGDEVESLDVSDEKNLPPDREFLSKELNQKISSALAKLDEDKRLVFTLKELQNLSYQEISEITGYAIPKLKTDLHRAKNEMRRALAPYLEVKK
ncbi:MAG: sigma-70 family RNA polymerase sigma factor [Pyrinomonadaceae bacterium]|nr:sigma-70 family RNA polymerase sigma factor [Pyrinomonadaceae bacterium]